jgi:hypothetical protein
VPTDPASLSRRTALRAAGVTVGLAAGATLLTGCQDDPEPSGKPGASDSPGSSGSPGGTERQAPSTDPAVAAALRKAAGEVQQLAGRYRQVGQAFPALSGRLSTGSKHHAAHLAKLTELGAPRPSAPKLPAVPTASAAALADLAGREQRMSVIHATAATKLSGPAARLLASIAASESQLAATLGKKATQ